MNRPRHSLSEPDWPVLDRQLWQQAQRKGDVIEPDGKAANWRPATLRQVAKGYGLWLGFLGERERLDPLARPDTRVDADTLRAYVEELKRRDLASTTITSRVTDLHEAIRIICPQADRSLLAEVRNRLQRLQAPRRNKQTRIAPNSQLARLAMAYLESLPALPCQSERMRASWFRDGLIVLLLAYRPIRLRNLTAIEIDRHLVRQGDQFALSFEANETKDHLPISPPCPVVLTPWIDSYLEVFRPLLLRGEPTPRLWLSMRGRPVAAQTLYIAVCKLTARLIDRPLNPHLFRDCLVSEMAERAPEHLLAASRILGHASLGMTNRHYNQAQMLSAIKAHQNAVIETFDDLEQEP